MKRILLIALCSAGALAHADTCLQTDKKGHEGDSRYYDYGRCKPTDRSDSYNSVNAIGGQIQNMMQRSSDASDRGYSDAEREAYRREQAAFARSDQAFKDSANASRAAVKYGASAELHDIDYSKHQFQNAGISAEQQQAVRNEIGTAISAGKLLEAFPGKAYGDAGNTGTWASTDPAQRWKTCEVGTQLVRAYAFGDFIKPEQKNPGLGLAIATAGYLENCGGTAYWLGRIYEEGNSLVPGVDKTLGKSPKWEIEGVYDTAILNGYTPAYERMAELYRLAGPARFRGKTYYSFPSDFFPYWSDHSTKSDEMFLMKVQYSKCLQADPANLVCARGLQGLYHDKHKDFLDDYSNYDPDLASYYDKYVKNLEELLTKAGQPVPAQATR